MDVHIESHVGSEVDGEIHTRKSFCWERASWMASAGEEVFHNEDEGEAVVSSGCCGMFSSSVSIVVDFANLVSCLPDDPFQPSGC